MPGWAVSQTPSEEPAAPSGTSACSWTVRAIWGTLTAAASSPASRCSSSLSLRAASVTAASRSASRRAASARSAATRARCCSCTCTASASMIVSSADSSNCSQTWPTAGDTPSWAANPRPCASAWAATNAAAAPATATTPTPSRNAFPSSISTGRNATAR